MSVCEARKFTEWVLADEPKDLPTISDVDGEDLYREFWVFLDRICSREVSCERIVHWLVKKSSRYDFSFSVEDYQSMVREALLCSAPLEYGIWELQRDPSQHSEQVQQEVNLHHGTSGLSPKCCLEKYQEAVDMMLFDLQTFSEYRGEKFALLTGDQQRGIGWIPIRQLGLSCCVGGGVRGVLRNTLPRDLFQED